MIVQIVDNAVREGMEEEYVAAAQEFAVDASANDTGCLGMEIFGCAELPGHVFIVSRWEDRASMEASTSFLRHKAKLKPAFLGNETTLLERLDV